MNHVRVACAPAPRRERRRKTHILHLEAEPQYSRSQVEPGNEIREVLPPVVQDARRRSSNQKMGDINSGSTTSVVFFLFLFVFLVSNLRSRIAALTRLKKGGIQAI